MLPTRQENNEVLYGEEPIIKVTSNDIQWLKNKAGQNERKRIRLCAHRGIDDLVHEMLIIHARDTFIRPHKHLGKPESFHIVEGMADVILFDDDGCVNHVIRMGKYETGLVFYYRISMPVYHTLLIHSDVLVFHEITSGPFNHKDAVFAPWAPDEDDKEAHQSYLSYLSSQADSYRIQSREMKNFEKI
jgi:cupin fold WbuC family metalloprotein